MKLPTKNKRLKALFIASALNFTIFGAGVLFIEGIDITALGAGLLMINGPLYAYIAGESFRPSKKG
jgi:hypothetical protein